MTEIKLGIMCACLPTLPPLFRRVRNSFGSRFTTRLSGECTPSDESAGKKEKIGHEPEVQGKKQAKRGWYSAALSGMNGGDEETKGSREGIVTREDEEVSADGEEIEVRMEHGVGRV